MQKRARQPGKMSTRWETEILQSQAHLSAQVRKTGTWATSGFGSLNLC